MHKGGIAYIREDSIRVPDFLLKSINIHNFTRLSGIYYPTPEKYITDKSGLKKNHDFIFSPIDFNSWPFLLRINIRIKDIKGYVSKVATILSDLGINIITADCHKAGHRYLIWSIIGEVEQIKSNFEKGLYRKKICKENKTFKKYAKFRKKDKFIRLEKLVSDLVSTFIEGENEAESLKNQIVTAGKKYLFNFEERISDSEFPITIVQAKTLPYHYWELRKENLIKEINSSKLKKEIKQLKKELEKLKKSTANISLTDDIIQAIESKEIDRELMKVTRHPFNVNVEHNRLVFNESTPNSILNAAGINFQGIPTFGFANIHTTASRLRVTVIDKKEIIRYKKIIIHYQSNGLGRSSKGYVSTITGEFNKAGLDLYNISNRIMRNEKLFETGTMEFIARYPAGYEEMIKDNTALAKKLESIINLKDINIDVRPINPYRIFVSIISNFFFREQFIKLCQEVGREVGLLEDTFVFVKDNTDSTTDAVVKAMKESDGVLQFYIDFAQNKKSFSHWLDAEYFAANAINLPIVRIKEASQKLEPIVDKDILALELNMSDSKEILKEVVREALEKLITKMQQNKTGL